MVGATFLTGPIFGHAGQAAHFDDAALARAMLTVEKELAAAQADVGLIPDRAGRAIGAAIDGLQPDIGDLARGVEAAAIPVPALVAQIRAAAGPDGADWVHYGATSQDIVDSAIMLCARAALADLASGLTAVLDRLEANSRAHAHTPYIARTRGQFAVPITLGLRFARWAQPLIGLERDLDRLTGACLRVQLGGAAGNLSVMGPAGVEAGARLATALGLSHGLSWHTDRTPILGLAHWLHGLTAALAKLGTDTLISTRGEVAELRTKAGGGSSTMPHKSNTVSAEALGSIHVLATACLGGLTASAVHGEERDGVHWPVEWCLIPQIFELAGAALHRAAHLLDSLEVRPDILGERLFDTPQIMAEAAVFKLLPKLGREGAVAAVKEALATGDALADALGALGHDDIDWATELDPKATGQMSEQVRAQIFGQRATRR
ncbi:MAG: lyase family protein [Pseudomonadota bacterium]